MIWLQIKATDRPHVYEERAISLRVERRDLIHWWGEQYPVILVMHDASRDQAHWLHVQSDLGRGQVFELAQAGSNVTVHVPLDQVLHREALGAFKRLKVKAIGDWKRQSRRP